MGDLFMYSRGRVLLLTFIIKQSGKEVEMIRILLVRQKKSQLTPGELSTVYRALGNPEEIDFKTTEPNNEEEHAKDCQLHKPTVVILPFAFASFIPSQAMHEGFRHTVITTDGLSEIVSFPSKPVLKPFMV